ncbi:hypothetical protein OH491_15370 [Termitidicoccus mucosus]|uniref:hypothetical protein n=1 Tax=Termitidicoccus mucosus TaxID=1184151 RepID=UPI003183A926
MQRRAPGGPRGAEASAFSEINRLHAEARRLAGDSRRSLDAALSAAWRAGQLLIAEKARIRRRAGQGAWLGWLETRFHGGVRTAQRYMQLARRADTPGALRGLGLRQAYLRLGIPISSKTSGEDRRVRPKLPPIVTLAARLTRLLRRQLFMDIPFPDDLRALRQLAILLKTRERTPPFDILAIVRKMACKSKTDDGKML